MFNHYFKIGKFFVNKFPLEITKGDNFRMKSFKFQKNSVILGEKKTPFFHNKHINFLNKKNIRFRREQEITTTSGEQQKKEKIT